MTTPPRLLTGLSQIAADYDTLICDVWGVLHDGATAHAPACAALKKFRDGHGRVVLLSNAPRPAGDLEEQFLRFGVPLDCYDTIVTSGAAAREDLARRAARGGLAMHHLGPARDRSVFAGLDVTLSDVAGAEIVLCTGPYNDEVEGPDDYKDMLADMKAQGLPMLCANPDLVVQRGGKLVYCAGSLARAYEAIGGAVVYYGKPHLPIYQHVRAFAGGARRLLAIGDGLNTDIKGANAAGIDALFIADGIHGEDIAEFTQRHLADLFAGAGVTARAAMRALVW
ncbi:MAG TPA: TIGR01459 family HAD-type hydrolase [Rhizomicrobium sp.]|jgi:HAD superfamily hydrolase (TIGR01459 family)|nr:TIGR01459 family HAD-type hydrolase [Rhizomicrobium sp.]